MNTNFIYDIEDLNQNPVYDSISIHTNTHDIMEAFSINSETDEIISYNSFKNKNLSNFFINNILDDLNKLSQGDLYHSDLIQFNKL